MAYILGTYLGDGYCYRRESVDRKKRGVAYFGVNAINQHFFKAVCRSIHCLYGVTPVIRMSRKAPNPQSNDMYYFRFCNRQLADWLVETTDGKNKLPDFGSWQRRHIVSFLRGLMDSEGHIG